MEKWQLWTLNTLAAVILITVLVNIFLILGNRSLRAEVANRQIFINQSAQLNQLNTNIIRSLAEIAANKNDSDLKALLNDNGITFQITPPATGGAPKVN